jgi:hypothetical protein
MKDTVEHQALGMAALIIADDEKRRAQELVCLSPLLLCHNRLLTIGIPKGRVQYSTQTSQLGFEA